MCLCVYVCHFVCVCVSLCVSSQSMGDYVKEFQCWCGYMPWDDDLEYSDSDDVCHASAGFVFTLSEVLLIKVLGFALDSLQVWGRSQSVSKMFQRCALNPQACHFGLKPGQSACAKLVRKRRRNPLGWDYIAEYCTSQNYYVMERTTSTA